MIILLKIKLDEIITLVYRYDNKYLIFNAETCKLFSIRHNIIILKENAMLYNLK